MSDRCEICGADLDWQDCSECGGDGWEVSWHTSPLGMFSEWDACDLCGGEGGQWYCLDEHASWHRAVAARAKP